MQGRALSAVLLVGTVLWLGCGPRIGETEQRQALNRARLAASMMMEGEFAQALAEARRAVELDPTCLDCKLTLATVYSSRGEWEQAEGALREILEAEPANPYALNGLAAVYLNLGRPAEAAPLARQAAENEEFNGRHLAYYNLGWSLVERQQYQEALEAFGAALREEPRMCAAHYRVGEVFFRLRRFEDALGHLEQAVAPPPRDSQATADQEHQIVGCGELPAAQHLLGMTLIALGREADARAPLQRCVELATARTDLGRQCAQQLNGLPPAEEQQPQDDEEQQLMDDQEQPIDQEEQPVDGQE